MTSTIGELKGAGIAAGGRTDNQKVFRRARRHSRLVRVLRIAVPMGTVFVCTAIALLSWFDPIRMITRLPIDRGKLVVSGTKITMESPKLAGFTRDSRPYEVHARAAAQDITNPDIVELTDIRAKLESQDKTPINLTAVDGVFNRKSGVLKLNRDIILSTPLYRMNLHEAVVETTTNNVVSNQPVLVTMPQGTLNAKRLEVSEGGDVIRFIGDVVMNLQEVKDPKEQMTGSR